MINKKEGGEEEEAIEVTEVLEVGEGTNHHKERISEPINL